MSQANKHNKVPKKIWKKKKYIYIYKEPIIEWVKLKGCNGGIWRSVRMTIAVDRGDEKAKLKERERGDNTHWAFMLSFSFIWTLNGTDFRIFK